MGTGTLVNLLILFAVLAIVLVAGWWVLQQISLPEPIHKIVMILLVVVVAVIAIIILLNLGGITRIGGHAGSPLFAAQLGGIVAAAARAAA